MENARTDIHGASAPSMRVRAGMFIACAALAGPSLFVALLALGLAKAVAGAGTAALLFLVAILMRSMLPSTLSRSSNSQRVLLVLFLVLSGAAAYRLGHMSVYMLDATNKDFVFNPMGRELPDEVMNKPFFLKHNCFTCYIVAAHLAGEGCENIYSQDFYRDAKTPTPIHQTIGDVLNIDRYQYPPPFLVLPKALMMLGHDFFQLRTFWFAINIVMFCITAIAYANWLGGPRFSAHWLPLPMVLLATTTLSAIEIGNVHFLIITLSLLSMLLLEQGRYVSGGAVLGYCAAGKIFPGVLLAYLVFARRWKAAAATGLAMIGYVLITLAIFGTKPFSAFVESQLPRLASGEAFSFAFEVLRPLALNLSVMGIPHRLSKLGLLGGLDPAATAKIMIWVFTLILLALVAAAGTRSAKTSGSAEAGEPSPANRRHLVLIWFALLTLGQMRSPFLPWGYGNVINLWLISTLLAMTGGSIIRILPLVVLWAVCQFAIPLPFGPPTVMFDLAYVLVVVVAMLVLCITLTLRRSPILDS